MCNMYNLQFHKIEQCCNYMHMPVLEISVYLLVQVT